MKKILVTQTNLYGDEIPVAELYQEGGLLRLWEINCFSALHYGLGNCLCENHLPSTETPISTADVIQRFGAEALDGFNEPGDVQLVFDAFGIEKDELETYLRVSYTLGINPLPAMRKLTDSPIIFSEEPGRLVFPDEEPGTIIFAVNSRGEIFVVTVEGRQEGGMRVLEGSTEPDLGDPDPVGMPELAIPAQF